MVLLTRSIFLSRRNCITRSLVFILCWILIQTQLIYGRSVRKSHGHKNTPEHFPDTLDEMSSNQGVDLIGLIEEHLTANLHEDDQILRRVVRTNDEDIDDEEDSPSEEDDDEDDENTQQDHQKSTSPSHLRMSRSTPSGSTSTKLPVDFSSIKLPSTGGMPLTPTQPPPIITKADLNSTTDQINSNSTLLVSNVHPPEDLRNQTFIAESEVKVQKNSTGKVLGGALDSTRPSPPVPSIPHKQLFPGRPPPGFPVPHAQHHPSGLIPGKPPPSGFPGQGKLPPNFLKNILAPPRPPPKKGELYLPEDYNNLVIPKLNLGKLIGINSYSAVPVLVFLNIRSVRDIDETMETLTLDVDLVIEWVDGFLFDPISASTTRQADITLNPIFLKKIWRPDIYIDEIVKVKRTSLMSKPLKLKFNPSNGFISYTTRLTVQLNCDMIYIYYPADTHRCEFTLRSYSYFGKDMQLSWLGAGVYLQDPYDPNFDLQVESIGRMKLLQTFRRLTNDTYDALTFTILARRKLSFHMVQTYLPSIFFIVITWLCFLVPSRMVEARIGISMTTLLTLTSMFASVRESTPIVSYVKAIDIWMVFCIFFVFLTLLEFATLVWFRSRREDAEEQKLEHQRKLQNRTEKDAANRSPSLGSIELHKYERFAEFTEKFAFLIFSIVFIVFNIIYWSWLLVASNYFDWSVNSTLNADLN